MENLVSVALAFTAVAVSPGPANIATMTIAMRHGRKKSWLFGMGLSLGLAIWGLIAATGLGAILQSSLYLLMMMKIAGGLYLIYLAFQSARTAKNGASDDVKTIKEGRWFLRGLLLNLSNPKAVIAWMATLSMGMDVNSSSAYVVMATSLCIAIGICNYTLYALAFSFPGVMAAYKRFSRMIEGAIAGLFAIAGFSLIRSAFSR